MKKNIFREVCHVDLNKVWLSFSKLTAGGIKKEINVFPCGSSEPYSEEKTLICLRMPCPTNFKKLDQIF